MELNVIITSTSPGRIGKAIGDWFFDHARANPAGFDAVVLTDLAELDLPLYNEPKHPRAQDYQHEKTREWSRIVARSDAFVFVLPEYNMTAPPSFFNAVDYLFVEWAHKVAGFVSYGGISGGMRAVQSAKPILTAVGVMPITAQVTMPGVFSHLDDGRLTPTDPMIEGANAMIPELAKWAGALKPLRG